MLNLGFSHLWIGVQLIYCGVMCNWIKLLCLITCTLRTSEFLHVFRRQSGWQLHATMLCMLLWMYLHNILIYLGHCCLKICTHNYIGVSNKVWFCYCVYKFKAFWNLRGKIFNFPYVTLISQMTFSLIHSYMLWPMKDACNLWFPSICLLWICRALERQFDQLGGGHRYNQHLLGRI